MYVADLHIHSNYSRATSRDCTPEYLDLWARRKGIALVGTGDFTHPAWRKELEEKLEPAEEGLYVLKKEYRLSELGAPDSFRPRFVVTGEISSIYKKMDRVRKVHSLILLPGLEEAELVSRKLESIGNIHSDGRPILGLDCHDLLEIVLELVPKAIYVPAHIWTPHFSLFGAFSGFDSVEECFGDLSGHIHAMETGLSSDPPMNWRVSALDRYQLISNSDAHSPAKLGREANLLTGELSYEGLYRAIQYGEGLHGTIEFFPEEGKYHFDGHRKCHLCLSPGEALRYQGKCPVCGKKLTIGVSHRVEELADRPEGAVRENARPFESLVPLPEVIGASLGYAPTSVKVQKQYMELVEKLGSEFEILRNVPVEDIRRSAGYLISEGIDRLRAGKVERIPGFDGEYGVIKLFQPWEIEDMQGQMSFFDSLGLTEGALEKKSPPEDETQKSSAGGSDLPTAGQMENASTQMTEDGKTRKTEQPELSQEDERIGETRNPAPAALSYLAQLNERQREAVTDISRAAAVIAGPGSGKTKTLVFRILYMLENRKVKPSEITAVTFTNKAAREMEERLKKQLGKTRSASLIHVGTFHSLCLELLKDSGRSFSLADETETLDLAADLIKEYGLTMPPSRFLTEVSRRKISSIESSELVPVSGKPGLTPVPGKPDDERMMESAGLPSVSGKPDGGRMMESAALDSAIYAYQAALAQAQLLDFDDLLLETLKLFQNGSDKTGQFRYLLVDEFQDISPVQFALIKAWTKDGRELFVIGDPDQSIYGFRGSDSQCFDKLKAAFPDLKRIVLDTNYRSTPQIVRSSMAVIAHNPGEERSLKAARKEPGKPVRIVKSPGELSEAIFVAKEINRLVGGIDMLDAQEHPEYQSEKPRSFGDLAVLYRTHRQAELLEECLKKEGIPYVVAGRDDFLLEKTVRGSLCFFRCLAASEDALDRKLALKLLWDLEENDLADSVLENKLSEYRKDFPKLKPQKFLKKWMENEGMTENESMEKLSHMAIFYKTMPEFLKGLALGVESDLSRCGQKAYTADAVTLMTLHGSKGLEFPVTFLYGVRKGMIPLENSRQDVDLEEERRLFFVGLTRAREELILTTSGEESAFLGELPEECCHREDTAKQKKREEAHQLSLFDFL